MDIENEVRSAMPEIMSRIKSESLKRIEREAVEAVTRLAVDDAKQWAVDNLLPEVRAQLDAGKAGMVEAAKVAAKGIGDVVAAALIENAKKTMSQSWNCQKVAEALFKG